MAQKATHRQIDSSSPVLPVVLFGVDENGKPKGARFTDKHANLATKAAGHLKLQVLPIIGRSLSIWQGAFLPVGSMPTVAGFCRTFGATCTPSSLRQPAVLHTATRSRQRPRLPVV